MHNYYTVLNWQRTKDPFTYDTYDRTHQIEFGGGSSVTASSAAEFLGNHKLVNPEEMLAAACSSCHLLTFLAIAAKKGYIVDSYRDRAEAVLGPNAQKRLAVTKITLHPIIVFGGDKVPSPEQLKKLHMLSHQNCFIANSVNCEMAVE